MLFFFLPLSAYSKFNKYMSLVHGKNLILVGNSQKWEILFGDASLCWRICLGNIRYRNLLFYSTGFLCTLSSQWIGAMATNVAITWIFFFSILYISSSSPPLSPDHLLNEPLLLVGVCFVPKVCAAEQRLRTLALCCYFLSQISTPCKLPSVDINRDLCNSHF